MEKTSNPNDPRGLIYESYRIEGIHEAQCRTIFLDWALGTPDDRLQASLTALIAHYAHLHPEHPMTGIMQDGLAQAATPSKRRGGRQARHGLG